MFCSIHGNTANFILNGSRQFVEPEAKYVPDFVAWYVAQDDCPNYFARELKDDEVVGMQDTKPEVRSAKPEVRSMKRAALPVKKKGGRR